MAAADTCCNIPAPYEWMDHQPFSWGVALWSDISTFGWEGKSSPDSYLTTFLSFEISKKILQ
jgi:hypothetical protein